MTAAQAPSGHVDAWTLGALRRLLVHYRQYPLVYEALLRVTAALRSAPERTGFASALQDSHAGPMTSQEFAEAAGLKPRTVQRACQEGRLKAIKFGGVWLIDPGEVARMEGTR